MTSSVFCDQCLAAQIMTPRLMPPRLPPMSVPKVMRPGEYKSNLYMFKPAVD